MNYHFDFNAIENKSDSFLKLEIDNNVHNIETNREHRFLRQGRDIRIKIYYKDRFVSTKVFPNADLSYKRSEIGKQSIYRDLFHNPKCFKKLHILSISNQFEGEYKSQIEQEIQANQLQQELVEKREIIQKVHRKVHLLITRRDMEDNQKNACAELVRTINVKLDQVANQITQLRAEWSNARRDVPTAHVQNISVLQSSLEEQYRNIIAAINERISRKIDETIENSKHYDELFVRSCAISDAISKRTPLINDYAIEIRENILQLCADFSDAVFNIEKLEKEDITLRLEDINQLLDKAQQELNKIPDKLESAEVTIGDLFTKFKTELDEKAEHIIDQFQNYSSEIENGKKEETWDELKKISESIEGLINQLQVQKKLLDTSVSPLTVKLIEDTYNPSNTLIERIHGKNTELKALIKTMSFEQQEQRTSTLTRTKHFSKT